MTKEDPDTILLQQVQRLAAPPSGAEDDAPGAPERRAPWPRSRRAVRVAIAAVLVLATGIVSTAYLRDAAPAHSVSRQKLPPRTQQIRRGDLVTEVVAAGAVRYTGARSVKNHLTGIVTWAPSANGVIHQGKRLYSLDNKPVILLRGDIPAWREFKRGMPDGEDVRILERNLAQLGYTGFTVDEKFSSKTEAAVKEWQKNNGLPANGKIELGRVVFTPGPVRIQSAEVQAGDSVAPAQEVLKVTGFQHLVSAQIPANEQDLAVKGAKARIELPNGKSVEGTITSVGTEETTQDNKKVVPITVRPRSSRLLGELQSADVVVVLRRMEAKNVLFVPVTALLPSQGGGFAVQLMQNNRATVVNVKTGAFADGRVEITGPAIVEGARVGVPRL
ncbi:peptidoglycan-binding protein [Streptomyces griseofuscus]|uniref:peptidoglycan-binding protein n=1 Tax=Streptomyces griseofuscus TaxID=146922 RepID=UPI00369E7899